MCRADVDGYVDGWGRITPLRMGQAGEILDPLDHRQVAWTTGSAQASQTGSRPGSRASSQTRDVRPGTGAVQRGTSSGSAWQSGNMISGSVWQSGPPPQQGGGQRQQQQQQQRQDGQATVHQQTPGSKKAIAAAQQQVDAAVAQGFPQNVVQLLQEQLEEQKKSSKTQKPGVRYDNARRALDDAMQRVTAADRHSAEAEERKKAAEKSLEEALAEYETASEQFQDENESATEARQQANQANEANEALAGKLKEVLETVARCKWGDAPASWTETLESAHKTLQVFSSPAYETEEEAPTHEAEGEQPVAQEDVYGEQHSQMRDMLQKEEDEEMTDAELQDPPQGQEQQQGAGTGTVKVEVPSPRTPETMGPRPPSPRTRARAMLARDRKRSRTPMRSSGSGGSAE